MLAGLCSLWGETEMGTLETACKEKNKEACFELGKRYGKGIGVEKSYELFEHYMKESCALKYDKACSNLGSYYRRYTRQDDLALEYFRKTCDLDNGSGCNNVAVFYAEGIIVGKDTGKAKEYYELACSKPVNSSVGCINLGIFYKDGIATDKNPEKAGYYFEKACQSGHQLGCQLAERLKQEPKDE